MSTHLRSLSDLPHVDGALNYLVPMAERPRNYTYEPPAGVPRSNTLPETHIVPIYDARPLAGDLSLDREGFALLESASSVHDFWDDDELRDVYYPEAEAAIAQATGADRVFIFDHTRRKRVADADDRAAGIPRQPVTRVHIDHTAKSGPQRVRDLLGDEAEELLRGRVQVINLWRPIRGPLRDAPLAVCDARSVAPGDLVPSDLVYPNRVGETYAVKYNPDHHWFFVPAMRRDEALLIKCFDSETDGRARFVPHTAFDDPTMASDALPRESIEIRSLVFHHA
ncbi:MAG TPA: CmcJ/NvfI family oxidoreductase [Stellaceae bacterium]|nr:CmcJ/NvfI family oxidoreductase [Stellaceae bacterium]